MFVGVTHGIDMLTCDNQSSRVISVDDDVDSLSVCDNLIYTLIFKPENDSSGSWSVRVYGSDYQLVRSWRHSERLSLFNQLAVRKDSVFVPDRESKTIVQYSLTGEVERRIPCHVLKDAVARLCATSSCRDTAIVSCGDTVSCIDVSTGDCVWSNDSLEKPTAVCCDDADRVYVAVGGKCATIHIAVLDGDTGTAVLLLFTLSETICRCTEMLFAVDSMSDLSTGSEVRIHIASQCCRFLVLSNISLCWRCASSFCILVVKFMLTAEVYDSLKNLN